MKQPCCARHDTSQRRIAKRSIRASVSDDRIVRVLVCVFYLGLAEEAETEVRRLGHSACDMTGGVMAEALAARVAPRADDANDGAEPVSVVTPIESPNMLLHGAPSR